MNVYIRADGNSKIGLGHLIRCTAIADILKDDFSCTFLIKDYSSYIINEIKKSGAEYIVIDDYEDLLKEASELSKNFLSENVTMLLDGYNFNTEYQKIIKTSGCKLVYIDDFNDKHYVADALINNIPGFDTKSFSREDYTKLYLGTDYALLRNVFYNPIWRKKSKNKNKVLVSFGGSDNNIALKVINFLVRKNEKLRIALLVSDSFKNTPEITKLNQVEVYQNISALEVAELIATSELCIIPASSILNETSSIGNKILLGYFVNNQIQPYNHFIDNKLAIGLGDYRNLDYELFSDKFDEALSSEYLIKNQHKIYRFQQKNNLKNVFTNV